MNKIVVLSIKFPIHKYAVATIKNILENYVFVSGSADYKYWFNTYNYFACSSYVDRYKALQKAFFT